MEQEKILELLNDLDPSNLDKKIKMPKWKKQSSLYGEKLDKWRGLESIWVDMSWFNHPELSINKYSKCIGGFCGIGQVDWWNPQELSKLSSEEQDELYELCLKNKEFIENKRK